MTRDEKIEYLRTQFARRLSPFGVTKVTVQEESEYIYYYGHHPELIYFVKAYVYARALDEPFSDAAHLRRIARTESRHLLQALLEYQGTLMAANDAVPEVADYNIGQWLGAGQIVRINRATNTITVERPGKEVDILSAQEAHQIVLDERQ